MTWREVISTVKKSIKEVGADLRLPNKLVYNKVISKSNLIIQRESDALRLTNLIGIYQPLKCVEVVEIPAIDKYCSITSEKKLYRTKCKFPDLYFDEVGPIITNIRSVDRSGMVTLVNQNDIYRILEDSSNSKYDKSIYAFYEEGYIYITKKFPLFIEGFFVTDVDDWCSCDCECDKDNSCASFLDGKWRIPKRLEDQIISLVIEDLMRSYKRIQEDPVVNKSAP